MRTVARAAILTLLVSFVFPACQLFQQPDTFQQPGTGTARLALAQVGQEGVWTPNGGTYDLGNWARGYAQAATLGFRILNVGDGTWQGSAPAGQHVSITIQSDETNWMGQPYGLISNARTTTTIYPGDQSSAPSFDLTLRLGADPYNPSAPDIVPAGEHSVDVVFLVGTDEAFRATISYTVIPQTWGYLGMFVENSPELAGGSVSLGTGTLLDSIVYSTVPKAYYPQDMNSDVGTDANGIFHSTVYDAAQLEEGEYSVILWMDDDDSGAIDVGESTYYAPVTIAGGDAFLRVAAADLRPSVTEPVTVSAPGPDGTLVSLWLVPGGDLSAPPAFRSEASLVSMPIGSMVSYGLGTVVGGAGSTSMGNAPIPPGTYDLYCFVDTDYDFSAVTFSPLAEAGEYAARINGVVVTGAGTVLQASDFSVSSGGGPGPGGDAVSADPGSPSLVALDTPTSFTVADGTMGYVDFPTTSWTMGYGVYVTPTATALSLDTGYYSGTWVSNAVGSVNPTGYEQRQGFKAGGAAYMARISNYSGASATFDVTVREGILGAASYDTPVPLSLDAPAWIAASASDFSFVAGGGTATLQFDTLTSGLDVEVLSEDKLTTVFGPTTDGSETQLAKMVNVTGLANGVTYVLRVSSHVFGTNGASVGQLTISSP